MDAIEHVNRLGYVCLWARGDDPRVWITLAGSAADLGSRTVVQDAGGGLSRYADTTMDASQTPTNFLTGFRRHRHSIVLAAPFGA